MSKLPTLLDTLRERQGVNYGPAIRWGLVVVTGLYVGTIAIFVAAQFI